MNELYKQLEKITQYTSLYAFIRQDKFNSFIGNIDYNIDYSQGKIFFGQYNQQTASTDMFGLGALLFDQGRGSEPISADIHMLASIAVQPNTILWAHAPQYESIVPSYDIVHEIKKIGMEQNIVALTAQEIEYPLGEGEQAEAIISAAHTIGQVGLRFFGFNGAIYYVYPAGNGSYQVALLDGFNVDIPQISIKDILVKLPSYISSGIATDLELALEGLQSLGNFYVSLYKYSEINGTIRYTAQISKAISNDDDTVIHLDFTKDSIGRITDVNIKPRRFGDPIQIDGN